MIAPHSSRWLECHLPLWVASLHLKKIFDRIEYRTLFAALWEQGIDESMIALLLDLYTGQRGFANGSKFFDISRGVKQEDEISSLFFNAALEYVFRKWQLRLHDQG